METVGADSADAGELLLYTADSDQLIRELVTSGIRFADLAVRGASLEEAFLTLTESDRAHSARTSATQLATTTAASTEEVAR